MFFAVGGFLQTTLKMFDPSTLILGTIVFLAIFYLLKAAKRNNYPPGPIGLPFIGYVPFLGANPGEKFMKLKEKYGSVMSVRVGTEDWIVLNDFNAVNEAFVKKGDIFSGRPTIEFLTVVTGGYGIVMADYGDVWKNLRKFGLTTLRGFGVGKKGMEENIIEETPFLIENLTSASKHSIRLKISYGVSNIICRIVFGSRFSYDDNDFATMQEILSNFMNETWETKVISLLTLAPVLKHLPFVKKVMELARGEVERFIAIFDKIKEEHKATYDENDIRDFTDAFIAEMRKRGEGDPSFHDGQLLHFVRDVFEAGTTTTTSTLCWMFLSLLHFPECQEKIYDEIREIIGESGTPSMKHREDMPYTCAFIQEIMRSKPLLPIGVSHKTSDDAELKGYKIPKNTIICPNFWAVHHDSKVFENPEKFHPERFLDKNGKFMKSNQVIPFSIGPRHCLGEQLARMEIFIFLVGIMQRLKILPNPNHPPPPFESGVFNMFFYDCRDYQAIFEKR